MVTEPTATPNQSWGSRPVKILQRAERKSSEDLEILPSAFLFLFFNLKKKMLKVTPTMLAKGTC